mmetsp:Transcript_4571/g.14491  ORF Transcript_4571/g.14491 Transcript_4571/m.14491 type:complete len:234 (-) Transcript_4571:185-886(-)
MFSRARLPRALVMRAMLLHHRNFNERWPCLILFPKTLDHCQPTFDFLSLPISSNLCCALGGPRTRTVAINLWIRASNTPSASRTGSTTSQEPHVSMRYPLEQAPKQRARIPTIAPRSKLSRSELPSKWPCCLLEPRFWLPQTTGARASQNMNLSLSATRHLSQRFSSALRARRIAGRRASAALIRPAGQRELEPAKRKRSTLTCGSSPPRLDELHRQLAQGTTGLARYVLAVV